MFRFAANLSTIFTEYAFLDRFAAAADAGFAHVEFQFGYDHAPELLAARAKAAAVEVVLLNAPPGNFAAGERGLAAQPDVARFCDSITVALAYAEAVGARMIHVMSGIGDARDVEIARRVHANLEQAARRIDTAGRTMLIEPINARDMPGYFLGSFDQAAALLGTLAAPARLLFDLYHRQVMRGDVMRGLTDLMPLIGHVQIAGAPARHEPDAGELDYRRVLRHLEATGYEGFVGCEYFPAGATRDGLGWMKGWR